MKSLATVGTELTSDQLDSVDGGFVILIIAALAGFDAGLWGYILSR